MTDSISHTIRLLCEDFNDYVTSMFFLIDILKLCNCIVF